MRSTLIVAAVVGAFCALAWVWLGGAFGQLSLVVDSLSSAGVAASAARDLEAPSSDALEPQLDAPNLETVDQYAGPDAALAAGVLVADDGDEHIKQWLAADPEFQRAADELLHDPDPQVQQEARQLLLELGAPVPEASAEH